jgi:hypothetical protein
MRTRQIPRAEWFLFFQRFNRRHEGWLATLYVTGPRIGAQIEARELPLEGIVADPVGEGPIAIHLGQDPNKHLEHPVSDPVQVWVELDDNDAEAAVEIESSDGTKTILEFRKTFPVEMVDGLSGEVPGKEPSGGNKNREKG